MPSERVAPGPMQELDGMGAQADIELLADQLIGDGVVVAIDLDVVIDAHARLGPLGVDIALGGQGLHRRAVEGLKQGTARTG